MKLMQETEQVAGPLIERDLEMDGNSLKANILTIVIFFILLQHQGYLSRC